MLFLMGPMVIFFILFGILLGGGAVAFFFIWRNKKNPNSEENVLIRGLQNYAPQFAGLYEPMYSVAQGKTRMQYALFTVWNERVESCTDDTAFKAVFAQKFGGYADWGRGEKFIDRDKANAVYCKKAKKLVKLFFKAGIVRAHDTFVTGNAKNIICYERVGGGTLESGMSYEVLAPFWHMGNVLLNKGVAK